MEKAANPKLDEWFKEVEASRKRERHFRNQGRKLVKMYEAEEETSDSYNILWANTETLTPALYSATPTPQVERRYKDADPMGGAASQVTNRLLVYLLDPGDRAYAPFDSLIASAVVEALVPGRGTTRFKYDFEAETVSDGDDAASSSQRVKEEIACGEHVSWDKFLHSYAKTWNQVWWVAFEHELNKEEIKAQFADNPAAVAELLKAIGTRSTSSDAGEEGKNQEETCDTVPVLEVWDKRDNTVCFISEDYREDYLKAPAPDTLKLTGFFPCPEPLCFARKISGMVPVAPYNFYAAQAKELNKISVRITKIIEALKVRGFYDGQVLELKALLTSEDNTLMGVKNSSILAQGGALEKAIWLFPVEKLILVLQQLYAQRQQIKQVIYELTGVADIMRGSSQASETLGAQKLKNQWGTLRMKTPQRQVQRYVKDCLRIMAEIGVDKFSQETIAKMTGLPFVTKAEKMQAQAQLQQAQQMMQMQSGQPPQPGQPPAGPPPQLQQLLAQAQKTLSTPAWEDVLAILKDDMLRSYKIDIETNSTVDLEATEDKQAITDILQAISQFMLGIGPLVQDGSMPFDAAKEMLLAIIRRFRFGPQLEEALGKMQAPPPKTDPVAAAKAQAEQIKQQGEQAKVQGILAVEKAKADQINQQAQLDAQKAQLDQQAAQQAADRTAASHQLEMQKMAMQSTLMQLQHDLDLAKIEAEKGMLSAKVDAVKSMPKQTPAKAGK